MLIAVQLFISGMLLLYTAIIAPVQVFVWEFNEEECNIFPTMYFDIFVDIFFMVRQPRLLNLFIFPSTLLPASKLAVKC